MPVTPDHSHFLHTCLAFRADTSAIASSILALFAWIELLHITACDDIVFFLFLGTKVIILLTV